MKFLALLMAFFVLALSVVPCCSENTTGGELIQTSCGTGNQCPDICSPFFTCGTCSGFVFNSPTLITDVIPTVIEKVYPFLEEITLSEIAVDVWQPPKIS
ncbi:MAG: DUF6660 family protein [Chitinophagales bacterium]|nr:DUF6660 family protein [Chitinophagales bacterium]